MHLRHHVCSALITCCSAAQGVTMYDIDFDTAADQIKVLRKAIKGVQVMCAATLHQE
jgi:hypothetical protein